MTHDFVSIYLDILYLGECLDIKNYEGLYPPSLILRIFGLGTWQEWLYLGSYTASYISLAGSYSMWRCVTYEMKHCGLLVVKIAGTLHLLSFHMKFPPTFPPVFMLVLRCIKHTKVRECLPKVRYIWVSYHSVSSFECLCRRSGRASETRSRSSCSPRRPSRSRPSSGKSRRNPSLVAALIAKIVTSLSKEIFQKCRQKCTFYQGFLRFVVCYWTKVSMCQLSSKGAAEDAKK